MALTKVDDRGLNTPIDLQDNEKIRLGTGNDFELYHDGSKAVLENKSGYIQINAKENEVGMWINPDAAVRLAYDGNIKFETSSSGASVTGQLDVSGNANFDGGAVAINAGSNVMDFVDNFALRLGNSQDLAIYHNGSNSYIKNTTGWLNVLSDSIFLGNPL